MIWTDHYYTRCLSQAQFMSKATNSEFQKNLETKFTCSQFLCSMNRLSRISLQRIIILGCASLNLFWSYQKLKVLRVRETPQVMRASHLRKSTLHHNFLFNMKNKLNTIQSRKIRGGKRAYSILWNNRINLWSMRQVARKNSKTNCKSILKSLIQKAFRCHSLKSKKKEKNWLRAQNSQGSLITILVKMITSCQKPLKHWR